MSGLNILSKIIIKKLFITAGHSLNKAGASANGQREDLLTIEMKNLIVKAIHDLSPETEVWVDDDKDSLSTVIAKIKALATPNDILFDTHFNAAGNSSVKGTESFVALSARGKSMAIAERVSELTSGMLNTPNRGVKFENQSQHNRIGILHTAASSVLWEVEFITNKPFMANYHKMKERLAIGIANILLQELWKK